MDKAIRYKAAIRKVSKKATSSRKAALAFLVKAGIYTQNGRLRQVYRPS